MIEGLARRILNHYGMQHQKAKAIEELAELIVALQKDVLEGKEQHSRAVLEEIADVHIMLTQMLDDEGDKTMVSLIVDKKLKRQMRKTCKSCRWHIGNSPLARIGICFCSKSDERGNHVDGNLMTCQEWER